MGVVGELAAAMDPMEVMRAVSQSPQAHDAVCVERQGTPVETAWAEAI